MKRKFIVICTNLAPLLLATATATATSTAKTSLPLSHSPPKGSVERAAILDAIRPSIASELGGAVEFQVVVMRANSRTAYVYARGQSPTGIPFPAIRTSPSPAMRRWAASPFFDAIISKENGRWQISSYQTGKLPEGGSIREMCNFGAGLAPGYFLECDRR